MEKGLILSLFGIVLSVFLVASASALFMGLTDGYVKNMTGGIVSGASVTVTVSGCSGGTGNGCSGTTTSDINGYYIVNNLNLPKTVGIAAVNAIDGSGRGSNSGTADDTQVAHVNVTVCYPPSAPNLIPVSDAHSTGPIVVTFDWTPGTDPRGFSTSDSFFLDGTPIVLPPGSGYLVGVATHSWEVRTYNGLCYGTNSSSFNIWNNAPSAPTNLNATSDNSTGLTNLSWNSGTDPDGDAILNVVTYQNGTPIISTTSSSVSVPSELLIKWMVQTCDSQPLCSSWVTADSVTCSQVTTSTCPTCTCGGGGGGKGGTVVGNVSGQGPIFTSKKVELFCNGIPFSNQTLLRINFGLGSSKKINLYGVNWSLEDLNYCPWCYNGIKDFDEVGIDCGGTSCRPCTEAEIPQKAAWNYLIGLSVFVLILLAIYVLYKTGIFKKIFLRDKYYGV